jgi:excinuclease ABC subunit C
MTATVPPDGATLIRNALMHLPSRPGVYRMIDAHNRVLYVGKAKNLKARVSAYTRPWQLNARLATMVSKTHSITHVTTPTEAEALILEAALIKKFYPPYNVLLRDDCSFPFIRLTRDELPSRLMKYRGPRLPKGDVYGPFASVKTLDEVMATLQRVFLLRSCPDATYMHRTRPCLLYQIHRCSAPCTGEISHESYNELVGQARRFLSGHTQELEATLIDDMQKASQDLDFEKAAQIRDRLSAFATLRQGTEKTQFEALKDADLIAILERENAFCVHIVFIRSGCNLGGQTFFPKSQDVWSTSHSLSSFLMQFYDTHSPPPLLLISHALSDQNILEEALTLKVGHKIQVEVPKKGVKRACLQIALRNGEENLQQKQQETSSYEKGFAALKEALQLSFIPKRIEIYDNSHTQGADTYGAMVVSTPQGLVPKLYRRFAKKDLTLAPGDDFGMMRHMLKRRFSSLAQSIGSAIAHHEEHEEEIPLCPDLIFIDGGSGHARVAQDILNELSMGERIVVIGVAKGPKRNAGEETLYPIDAPPLHLPRTSLALYTIQKLRDEAHRFAIHAHRNKRSRSLLKSRLDDIPGIGPTRKRALLLHFGSPEAIKNASIEALSCVPGINRALAENIYAFFAPNRSMKFSGH